MDLTRVGWVVTGDRPELVAGFRFSISIPARELGGSVWRCDPGDDPARLLAQHRPSALVLGKAFHRGFLDLAHAAKAQGIPVLANLGDWYFDDQITIALSQVVDRVVVQHEAMAREVRQHFKVEPVLIEESYEGARGEPRFAPGSPIRLLWFGHSANLDTLAEGVRQITRRVARDIVLSIVTNEPESVWGILSALPPPLGDLKIGLRGWSLEAQFQKLVDCDIVLLPSFPHVRKQVKGHNRLVQAIHSGRLALAYPLFAYRELADFCWCGEDLGEGLEWALSHPSEALSRIAAGQKAIDARFAPPQVAQRWARLLRDVSAGR